MLPTVALQKLESSYEGDRPFFPPKKFAAVPQNLHRHLQSNFDLPFFKGRNISKLNPLQN